MAKNTYVLVHGAWLGAWAWDKLTPLLEREGHTVVALDLPAHGANPSPRPFMQLELEDYAQAVTRELDARPGPAILVGHGTSGAVVSRAAELRPDKVRTLVYLAAFLLGDGERLFRAVREDTASPLVPFIHGSMHGTALCVEDEGLRRHLCAGCSEEDVARVLARCEIHEPMGPLLSPLHLTEARYGRVPRVFIETRQDSAFSPELQRRLYTATPVQRVLSLDSGHCAFLSHPEALAAHLLSL
jgi:pimeloyl-ACP methyl ester carboxylesterase